MKSFATCLFGLLLSFCVNAASPPNSNSTQAVADTVDSSTNWCSEIGDFYYEIQHKDGTMGPYGNHGTTGPTRTTVIPIRSASKWVYGAYVMERRGDDCCTDTDRWYLNFTSGFTGMGFCLAYETVYNCFTSRSNNSYNGNHDGKFYYNGGHMQAHATEWDSSSHGDDLIANVDTYLNLDTTYGSWNYERAWPEGGIETSPGSYMKFLKAIADGTYAKAKLRLDILTTDGVQATDGCTNVLHSPVPSSSEGCTWYYGGGHWIERNSADTATVAYSSAGGQGVYPWIHKDKEWFGIVARNVTTGDPGYESMRCGRQIRKAWFTGTAQTTKPNGPIE